MTRINLRALYDATPAPETGSVTVSIQRWARNAPAVIIDGPALTVPRRVVVRDDVIDLPPSDGRYCIRWIITPEVRGVQPIIRYTTIPAAASVDFADLIDVDPETFAPTGEAVAAWEAAVARVLTLTAAAEESADRAGNSAFSAAGAAASALGHAHTAIEAEVGALAGAATAATARDEATAARTDARASKDAAAGSAATATTARDEATAARTDARASKDAAAGSAATATTARDEATAARTGAEAARDVSLAGQFAGAPLNSVDLNTITRPGMWHQSNGGNATLARNYPQNGFGGVLESIPIGLSGVVHRFTPVLNNEVLSHRGFWIRRLFGEVWQPWRYVGSHRVDQTAGRAIYMYDYLNSREQLVYGDTGWRDVSASLLNGWTGTLHVRRVGNQVELRGLLAGAAATSDTFLDLTNAIPGFRVGVANIRAVIASTSNTAGVLDITNNMASLARGSHGSASRMWTASWLTTETWPTVNPGNPIGSIPAT